MRLTTNTIVYNVGSFHSKKTGHDYNTVGLILDGIPKTFFVNDAKFNSLLACPVIKKFQQIKQPLSCKAMFDVRPMQKGFIVNIEDLTE